MELGTGEEDGGIRGWGDWGKEELLSPHLPTSPSPQSLAINFGEITKDKLLSTSDSYYIVVAKPPIISKIAYV
jgi:hypothetical protein